MSKEFQNAHGFFTSFNSFKAACTSSMEKGEPKQERSEAVRRPADPTPEDAAAYTHLYTTPGPKNPKGIPPQSPGLRAASYPG